MVRLPVLGLVGLALTAIVVMTPGRLSAQQCAGGRVVTMATQGRCCWPAQRWDAGLGRCVGPPRCPAGHHAAGDDCVLPMRPAAYDPRPGPPAGHVVAPPAPRDELRTVRRPIWGLAVAGIVSFGVGWLGGPIVTAVVGGDGGDIAMMAIPLAGPWVCLGACDDPDESVPALVIDGIIQAAGVTMFVLGLAIQTGVEVRAQLGGGVQLAVVPWFLPTGAPSSGLTLTLSAL